ncbi:MULTISPECIES: heme ABC transporter ATP-binding protein [unclassified Methanoculleus]|jgi:iron complex transport system ATP-binding protein|uniref:Cobalamin import ATP-binding protein BtuD n=1 Tax=Methanoculleus palmolei TaxID=72612 RepID=A0ABD8A9M3_9EURY|nr:heme ABC transporter ATP-binding protein [Methanoculleus sp. UBA377]MDD2473279.1 heme ABC transporter ATP-binding protein [Methanoculleus sp.]WOX55301.1 heme ABC transporter ATP-binding protein [Methanoculleus palmolei]
MKSVEIINIDVSYGAKKILEAISLYADKGEILGIIGPNGSGKTTLLKAMSRIVAPDSGEVRLNDQSLATFNFRELAQQIAVVPQDIAISFDYTVREIVMMGRHPYIGRLSSETARDLEVCDRAMHLTNVAHLADSSVHEISGGERQRVLIARALTQEPKVLLLDEATSNLDISHQIEILNIIRDLTGSVTVISVFHDLNLAACYCDRLIMLKEKKIVAVGEPEDVLTRETLKAVYGIDALVKPHPLTGRPYVLPIYERTAKDRPTERVHVVCGGGMGSDLLYALHKEGFRVSAGVLTVLDTDYATVTALGIPCVAEAPFCAISPDARSELERCIDEAHAVVITAMPIGWGNIENIRILERRRNKPIILLNSKTQSFQDFTGGEAEAIVRGLLDRGAVEAERVDRVLQILRETA